MAMKIKSVLGADQLEDSSETVFAAVIFCYEVLKELLIICAAGFHILLGS